MGVHRGRARRAWSLALVVSLSLCGVASSAIVTSEGVTVRLGGVLHLSRSQGHRSGPAAVNIRARFRHEFPEEGIVPELSGIEFALSPRIAMNTKGLPLCRLDQIRNQSTQHAMRVCGDAMVGTGEMWSQAVCHQCAEISTIEELVAFNGRYRGGPAIFLLGPKPNSLYEARISVFRVERTPGDAGYMLAGTIPEHLRTPLESEFEFRWRISYFALSLHRSYPFAGRSRSYLTASCPTSGHPEIAVARATFHFGGIAQVSGEMRGECGAS
jgi:hypothetical protein